MEESGLRYLLLTSAARTASWDTYPALNGLLDQWPGTILWAEPTALEDQTAGLRPLLLMADNLPMSDLGDLVRTADRLHAQGEDDALLVLGRVAVGALSSGVPLSYGNSGHFMTLLLPVGEFARSGTLYTVDSLPRSLGPEEDERYSARYTFAVDHWSAYQALKRFHQTWEAQRVNDNVLRMQLTEEAAQALAAYQSGAGEDPRPSQIRQLGLYGKCLTFLLLP